MSNLGSYREGRRDGVAEVVAKVRAVIEEFKETDRYHETLTFVEALEEALND